MEKKDVEHLAKLSRIALHEGEAEALATEISSILGYVSEINEITGGVHEKKVGALKNVMREDGEAHPADTYTEALIGAAPSRQGRYIKVKKILGDKAK